jgi:spectinomycin phosphotransferase
MREPPAGLSVETLRAALRHAWGLEAQSVTFLPLGYDAAAWVYRVDAADGATFFLKARLSVSNEPALLVPHALHEQGVRQVVAPIATPAGALWAQAGDYALILYPFVEGQSAMARGLSDAQWVVYGDLLRQIHGAAVTPELAAHMQRETFAPGWVAELRQVDDLVAAGALPDEAARELGELWLGRRAEIQEVLARADELGRRLAGAGLPFVICHADIHTNNVLVDGDGALWVVDWDETVLAPRERDLMFVTGGGISTQLVRPRDEELLRRGYGPADVDAAALAYYRAAWAVSDIGSYGAQVLLRPDLGELTRREGLTQLAGLFRPGEIVDLALRAAV